MNNSKFSVGGLIFCILGGGSVIGVLASFINEKIFLCVVFCILAIIFIGSAKTAFSKKGAKADSNEYLKYGAESKKLVDSVLANEDIDNIINNDHFSEKGVKVVVLDNNNKCSLVLTKECIYEGIFKSYNFPAKGIQNIKFEKGQEIVGTQSVQLDEDRMARMGYAVGGLGGAVVNASSAREINAQGGAQVGVNSGFFAFDMKVRSEISHVYVIIIRKDYAARFGNIFGDCFFREGKCYNVYYVQNIKGGAAMKNATEKMTELLGKIQKS